MHDYYFISYVYDDPDEDIANIQSYMRDLPQPRPINLVFPSAVGGRRHNALLAAKADAGDPREAVEALAESCGGDASAWPSHEYALDSAEEISELQSNIKNEHYTSARHNSPHHDKIETENDHIRFKNDLCNSTVEFQSAVGRASDDSPEVLNAARSLYFERQRQMALYGLYAPAGRMPSDYELFTAWACLPRADKQGYVREVSASVSCGGGDMLESRHAVGVLYRTCPDSQSWPSLQYFKVQEYLAQQLLHNHYN